MAEHPDSDPAAPNSLVDTPLRECLRPFSAWSTIARLQLQKIRGPRPANLENVLGQITSKYQRLQHSLIGRIQLVDRLVLWRLLRQRNQRTCYFEFIFAFGSLKYHDVRRPFHGMAYHIIP